MNTDFDNLSDAEKEAMNAFFLRDMTRIQKEAYRKNPMLWVKEVLGRDPKEFKWDMHKGYKNHVWDGDKNPLYEAWMSIANQKWACLSAATGTGKTFSAAYIMLWFLDCFTNSLIITIAPKEEQLRMNLWSEVSKLIPKFRETRPRLKNNDLKLFAEGLNANSKYRESWVATGFGVGVSAGEESATKAQGFHRKNMLIIMEEMTGIDAAVVTAFKNTCTGTNNIILGLGNPDSEDDELGKFGALENVNAFRISAYDYPNVVLKKEIYHGAASIASIERRKNEFGEDADMFLSRVRGITPKGSSNSLIKGEWIDATNKNHVKFDDRRIQGLFNSVGVDVANSEKGDMAALCWIQDGCIVECHEFQCANATHLAYNIAMDDIELSRNEYANYHTSKIFDMKVRPDCIGVDSVGVGVATVNALKDLKINVEGLSGGEWLNNIPFEMVTLPNGKKVRKNLYAYANLRSQMYYQLREDIRKGVVCFDIADKELMSRIRKELTVIRFKMESTKIAVEEKHKIIQRHGKSPNLADAIAYANWMSKGYRVQKVNLPFTFGTMK